MKLLFTASSLENLEKMLNAYHFSTTYKILDDKVMFKTPLRENTNLTFKMKGKKYQIYRNE